ncbi:MAG TPA: amidase [Anaeromyxobacteraceae bacterium]|nr:amidase [Anaeromyxobacteraceae bacterium]
MQLPEYDALDATALAGLVARGEVTAAELLEAALERADLRNPAINAITARYDDEARRRASAALPKGPFTGVPFVIKDLITAWKGHPMSAASRLQAGWVPDYDSEVVKRLEGAGLVLFGTTNAPEFGILAHTEPALHGPARNPWNPDHTPGGSSGGSGAAVAARIVPAAHGNDGGGSIRIPASHCGLFGLKPTRGRVTFGPGIGESWMGFTTEGVLTRSVRDSAALLDVLAGHVPGDPYAAPPQARPYAAEVGAPPGRLRVACTDRSLFGHATHPECSAAVRDAATLLAGLGHEVEEAAPPFRRDEMVRAYLYVVAASTAAEVDVAARRTGRKPGPGTLEPVTLALDAAGRILTSADLATAIEAIQAAARDLARFFERWDVLVTPTVAQPPVRVGALEPKALERLAMRVAVATRSRVLIDRLFEEVGGRSFDATGFTMPFNQTGQPAMSVPFRVTADGLPLGVQVVGRFGDEATLFRLAAQLEAARPWAHLAPPGLATAR